MRLRLFIWAVVVGSFAALWLLVAYYLASWRSSVFLWGLGVVGVMLYAVLAGYLSLILHATLFHERVMLPIPADVDVKIQLPASASAARVLISFKHNIRRFHGSILILYAADGKFQLLEEIVLPEIRPSFSFRVPRWLPVSDAGEVLHFWPAALHDDWAILRSEIPSGLCVGSTLVLHFQIRLNQLAAKTLCRSHIPSSEEVEIELRRPRMMRSSQR